MKLSANITMEEYQRFARGSCLHHTWNAEYLTLGLCGESGEVAEKIKKSIRDESLSSKEVAKELGDVLWYLTNLANYLGYDLEEVAEMNRQKLLRRVRNNTLHGDGDNR